MICDACKKNEATVKLIAIIDGAKTERHLCTECVEKQKRQMREEGMQSMLSAIISGQRRSTTTTGLRCSNCGLSYDEFRKTSRLGCAQCYADFRTQLRPLLLRLHGRTQHAGRMPERVDAQLKRDSRLEQLRRDMEIAIACEDFEQAASLRDELRSLTTAAEGGTAGA